MNAFSIAVDSLAFGDRVVALADIPPTSLAYLLQYGLNKTLQDSVSGHAKTLLDAYTAFRAGSPTEEQSKTIAKACEDAKITSLDGLDGEAWAALVVTARKEARLASVLAGTMGEAGGGTARLTPVEKVMKDIALERIRAAAIARKKPMPKGDQLAEFVSRVLAADEKAIRRDAEARLAKAAKAADDAGALFD